MQVNHLPEAMTTMPKIDAHAHLFPDKIAERAVSSIGDFYGLQMNGTGTVEDLTVRCRKAGITHVLVCSTATHRGQADSVNTFISRILQENRLARQRNPGLTQFIAFGTAYPGDDLDTVRRDVDQVLDLSLAGIKLHPDFQKIAADSDGVFALCRVLEGRLPILIHAGDHRYQTSAPERIARLARAFPQQTFIAAHFGGWSVWSQSLQHLASLPNVFVDSSSSLMLMSPSDARRLIDGFGVERVLFGTDYPAEDPLEELSRFMAIPLNDAERRAILYENARQLFKV